MSDKQKSEIEIIATSTTPSTFEIAEEDGIPYGSTPVTDSPMRDHSHRQADRIKELEADVARYDEQIDSLWERTDIYVDLQEKQRRQIDALNATANRALGMAQAAAEGIGDVRRTIDDLAKNCCDSALSDQERLDLLEDAVRMSLEQHKATQLGMVHWGSGDFQRMLDKLQESKEAK